MVWIRDWATPSGAEGPLAVLAGMYGDAGNAERISESLRLAQARLCERRERTRLIVYIHDGQPTDETPQAVAETWRQCAGMAQSFWGCSSATRAS